MLKRKKHHLSHFLPAQQIVLQGQCELPHTLFPKIDRENAVLDGENFPASKGFVSARTGPLQQSDTPLPNSQAFSFLQQHRTLAETTGTGGKRFRAHVLRFSFARQF